MPLPVYLGRGKDCNLAWSLSRCQAVYVAHIASHLHDEAQPQRSSTLWITC